MTNRLLWPVRKVAGETSRIFVTFDDGPDNRYTPEILSSLDDAGAKATFFLLGGRARAEPLLVREIADAGHGLGLHGMQHTPFWFRNRKWVRQQLLDNLLAIRAATPDTVVELFRPPYGRFSFSTIRVARSLGLRTVLWSLNSRDYRAASPEEIFTHVLSAVSPGDIVLFHDGPRGGDKTSHVLPKLLSALTANGFELASLADVL